MCTAIGQIDYIFTTRSHVSFRPSTVRSEGLKSNDWGTENGDRSAHLITSLSFFLSWLNVAIEYSSINQVKENHFIPLDGLHGTPHKTFHYICLVHGPYFLLYSRTRSGFTFYSPVTWWTFSAADIVDVWTVERTWTSLLSGRFITNCFLFTINSACPSVNADVPLQFARNVPDAPVPTKEKHLNSMDTTVRNVYFVDKAIFHMTAHLLQSVWYHSIKVTFGLMCFSKNNNTNNI